MAHQVARDDAVTAADEAYKVEKKRLYREHAEAVKGANAKSGLLILFFDDFMAIR